MQSKKLSTLFATHCLCCGRPLVDAISVETGVGPVCRQRYEYDRHTNREDQLIANRLIHEAALNDTPDKRLLEIAEDLDTLNYKGVATKIRDRFVQNPVAHHRIAFTITREPAIFGRGQRAHTMEAFVIKNTWMPGFEGSLTTEIDWRDRALVRDDADEIIGWAVKPRAKKALWKVLSIYFEGEVGVGPKGPFMVPKFED